MSDTAQKNNIITCDDVVRLLQQYKANVQRYLGCRVHLALIESGEIEWSLCGAPRSTSSLVDQVVAGLFVRQFDKVFMQLPVEIRRVLFHCAINHDFEVQAVGVALNGQQYLLYKTLPTRTIAERIGRSPSYVHRTKKLGIEMIEKILLYEEERQMILYYLHERLKPYKKHEADAGWDLRCAEPTTIRPGETKIIPTGVSAVIPEGYVGIIKCRSGLAAKGANVTGGVIDSTYRGEIGVIFQNIGSADIEFERFERVAQLIAVPCITEAGLIEGSAPLDTDRGAEGYGSTGRQ